MYQKNVGTCRATYVPHSVAPAVRQGPDGDLEILVSNPIGVFGIHWVKVGMDGNPHDYYFRQLWDWKLSAEVEAMDPEGLHIYAKMCGWTLARAHARGD
jgi:hypothetical protein